MSINDNTLKKEFSTRDVNRARNLITKKFGDATGIQSGYTKQIVEHSEGEVWEENGKKWTIKNGIKQTVTKFDAIKKLSVIPLLCPSCSKPMKNSDTIRKMYLIHGMCLDCVVRMESKLKLEGKYKEYESRLLNLNKNAELDDMMAMLDDWANQRDDAFITEAGDIEQWNGGENRHEAIKQLKENIKKFRDTQI
jgi:hypothetical protein